MRKKVLAAVMAGMLLLAGCGNNEKVIEGNQQNNVSGGGSGAENKTPEEGSKGDAVSGEAKGYVFKVKDTTVSVDADAAPIIEKLGEPLSYYEAASCAFEGLDKIYTYSGFELMTYPAKDKDCVSSVTLKDDSVATAEGICIGDSLDKLKQVYGSDGKEESGAVVYAKDGMKLNFILKNGEIASIEYRSTVLEQAQ